MKKYFGMSLPFVLVSAFVIGLSSQSFAKDCPNKGIEYDTCAAKNCTTGTLISKSSNFCDEECPPNLVRWYTKAKFNATKCDYANCGWCTQLLFTPCTDPGNEGADPGFAPEPKSHAHKDK